MPEKSGRRVVSAFIATAFAQDTSEAKLAAIMDDAEEDVLAFMTFPKGHRAKLHSTNPIERLNGEIKRRAEVVGIFRNDEAIVRLVGALLLEQNHKLRQSHQRATIRKSACLQSHADGAKELRCRQIFGKDNARDKNRGRIRRHCCSSYPIWAADGKIDLEQPPNLSRLRELWARWT